MNRSLLNEANKYMHQFMNSAKEEMGKLQEGPIGSNPRSQREISIMWKKLQEMPSYIRQTKMQEMANVAGHKGDGIDDCDLCKFIKMKASK